MLYKENNYSLKAQNTLIRIGFFVVKTEKLVKNEILLKRTGARVGDQ